MSELVVGSIAGLAANDYVVSVASGSQLTQPGMVLQVVSTTKTDTFSTSSTSPVLITGVQASITPQSTSSKIWIIANGPVIVDGAAATVITQIRRDGTPIGGGAAAGSRLSANSKSVMASQYGEDLVAQYLDSPATTSSITYSIYANPDGGTMYVGRSHNDTDTASGFHARTPFTITLMEIAG